MTEVKICMGSSCYARGNRDNIRVIQQFIEEKNMGERVKLSGVLCSDKCGRGPVIAIDGKSHYEVDANFLDELLRGLTGE